MVDLNAGCNSFVFAFVPNPRYLMASLLPLVASTCRDTGKAAAQRSHYTDYYNNQSQKLAEKRFQKTIRQFGYTF
jgi:hypothetical protein